MQVPGGFRDEARAATANHQAGKLILLEYEAQGTRWEDEARSVIAQALSDIHSKESAKTKWDEVILFTGHRIDSPKRKTPRFPAAKEQVARDAIRRALQQKQNRAAGSTLGISGGANGGDILFLEICDELQITTEMALALPPDQFAKASVENDDERWKQRFSLQLERHPNVRVLATSPDLPEWLEFKTAYDIWQRSNLWLLSEGLSQSALSRSLIALWDGKFGDGPGGTEDMVSLAKERDFRVVLLDTNKLFGLVTQAAG